MSNENLQFIYYLYFINFLYINIFFFSLIKNYFKSYTFKSQIIISFRQIKVLKQQQQPLDFSCQEY